MELTNAAAKSGVWNMKLLLQLHRFVLTRTYTYIYRYIYVYILLRYGCASKVNWVCWAASSRIEMHFVCHKKVPRFLVESDLGDFTADRKPNRMDSDHLDFTFWKGHKNHRIKAQACFLILSHHFFYGLQDFKYGKTIVCKKHYEI